MRSTRPATRSSSITTWSRSAGTGGRGPAAPACPRASATGPRRSSRSPIRIQASPTSGRGARPSGSRVMTFHLELRRRRSRLLGFSLLATVLLAAGCTALKRYAYEGFGRDGWQQPEKVVQSLALKQGERIADLGSGGGYFTFRFSQAVGPAGKVYAVDVDSEMLDYVAGRAKEDGSLNIQTVAARYDDPLLPESGV